MKVAIHQPNFAPWLGFFHKMAIVDIFVLLDDVQYSKNSYTNRVRIRGGNWLTIPVSVRFGTPITECRVAGPDTAKRIISRLAAAYPGSSVVTDFAAMIAGVDSDRLVDFNEASISFLASRLNVRTSVVRSSALDVSGQATDRLRNLVLAVGGDTYVSGEGGRGYQDLDTFARSRVSVEFSDFVHPVYTSRDGEQVTGLSALDYLDATEREAVVR